MILLKNKAIALALILFSASLSCYLIYENYFNEDDEPRFQWPEMVKIECEPDSASYECDFYAKVGSTVVKTLLHPSDGSVWIAELDGKITSWNGEFTVEVANLSQQVSRCHNEQGLLGFSFTHDFNSSGEIILSYTDNMDCDGPADLSGIVVAAADIVDGQIDLESIVEMRRISKENRNHNGGNLLSLGDGTYLWSVGDGGGSGDPGENGQNIHSPLGTIQYFTYHNKSVQPVFDQYGNESDYVLHYGLRNPWKFDIDNSGQLWIADVGQYCYEEINLVPIFNQTNFGWSQREGMHNYDPSDDCTSTATIPEDSNLTDPIVEYAHTGGNCSITGGFWMDWGPNSLQDSYIYGDFCTGAIWQISQNNGDWEASFVTTVGTYITGFGQGINDELLIFSWTGEVYSLSDA